MVRSFKRYFQDRDHQCYGGYTKDHFDTLGFMNDKYLSNNQNMISRLQNCLHKAISDEIILPKMIVIPLDEDLIQYLNHPGPNVTKALTHMIDAVMSEFSKLAAQQWEYLPKRSTREDYPKFIWIEAPLHNNFSNNVKRMKYNKALRDAAQFHDDMYALMLKKIWNPNDDSLYAADFRRFTNDGYRAYWTAIDATIKFADTILLKKKNVNGKPKEFSTQIQKIIHGNQTKSRSRSRSLSQRWDTQDIGRQSRPRSCFQHNDRYHWSRSDRQQITKKDFGHHWSNDHYTKSSKRSHSKESYRKMPTPPGYKKNRF